MSGVEDFFKVNNMIFLIVTLVVAALFVYGKGTILGWKDETLTRLAVYAALAVNAYTYYLLRRDVLALQSQKFQPPPPQDGQQFQPAQFHQGPYQGPRGGSQ